MSAPLQALLDPFTSPGSRTWWVALLTAAALAVLWRGGRAPEGGWGAAARALLRHPSTSLDAQLYLGRRALGLLLAGGAGLGGAWLVATRLARALDAALGVPVAPEWPPALIMALYSLALFVAWDASRFALHLALHRVPALWAFHQVHHSAERLTPLTYHRVHPVESALQQLRGAAVTGVVVGVFYHLFREAAVDARALGVPALGLAFNLATGNLRHSEVALRFPASVERWLLSPAQHQLHHALDPAWHDRNFGTWLALWDRLAGTLAPTPAVMPARFGLPPGARNHGDDLLSAWFGPFQALAPRWAPLLALAVAGAARAEDEAPPPPDEDEGPGLTILVTDEAGVPRVAGSAQKVDEASLERFEYDDIERVLITQVPGVATRAEDGFGLRPNIGIRGANSDRSSKLTLLEDGVPLAPAPYAAPAAYYFPMSTRMVGVEVFKGPAATRHGPQTIGGAINMLTRPVPWGQDYGVDLAAGLRQSGKAHAFWGLGGERFGVLVEGVHLRSAGFKELDGGGDTGFDRSELMLKARWLPEAGGAVQLKLGYANETSHETYLGLTLADYEANPYRRYAATSMGLMTWDRTQAELSWAGSLGRGWSARVVAYHHWLDRSWVKLNRFAEGPDLHTLLQQAPEAGQGAFYLALLRGEEDATGLDQALMIGTNARRFHSYGLQATLAWSGGGERLRHELEAGVRLHGDEVWRRHSEEAHLMQGGVLVHAGEPELVNLEARSNARALAAFVHDDIALGRLHVLPGLRVEAVRAAMADVGAPAAAPLNRVTPLPGLGLLAALRPGLYAFAGSYRGFSPVAPGQPAEVLPETSWNTEAGLRWGDERSLVELVGFYNEVRNLIGQCTMSAGCLDEDLDAQFSGGAVRVLGLEAAARRELELGAFTLPLDATYTLTDGRFLTSFTSSFPQFGSVSAGDALPYVPRHQASLRLGIDHARGSLSAGGVLRGAMLDAAGAYPATEADVPALFLLDASASLNLGQRTRLYATGTNLTRSTALTSWRPYGARPTAPLQVMVGVKVGPPRAL